MFTTTHLRMANETTFDQRLASFLKIGQDVTIIRPRPLQDMKTYKLRFRLPRNSSCNPNRTSNTYSPIGNTNCSVFMVYVLMIGKYSKAIIADSKSFDLS